ncbi:MAG TPA: hypothetical protein PLU43_06365 [Lachnospiraceae bacterium]|nr:hypothetical protein [Lachnospiraceae bacterium]
MSIFKKINYIFSKKQKVQSVLLCVGLFVGALLELVGVSFITQLVSLITAPEKIHTSAMLQSFYDLFHMSSDGQFFLYIVIALILVYVVKNNCLSEDIWNRS